MKWKTNECYHSIEILEVSGSTTEPGFGGSLTEIEIAPAAAPEIDERKGEAQPLREELMKCDSAICLSPSLAFLSSFRENEA